MYQAGPSCGTMLKGPVVQIYKARRPFAVRSWYQYIQSMPSHKLAGTHGLPAGIVVSQEEKKEKEKEERAAAFIAGGALLFRTSAHAPFLFPPAYVCRNLTRQSAPNSYKHAPFIC